MTHIPPMNPNKIFLIGIAGQARTGKDTVGKYLIEYYQFHRYAFADPLKRACCEMFGIDMSMFDDDVKEKIIPFWGFSPRQMAQLLGTEGGRNVFGDDIWIKRAKKEFESLIESAIAVVKANPNPDAGMAIQGMVITDVRFENEAKFIRDNNGYVIHITREDAQSVNTHVSESGVSVEEGDCVIRNNGSLEDLYKKVDDIMYEIVGGLDFDTIN